MLRCKQEGFDDRVLPPFRRFKTTIPTTFHLAWSKSISPGFWFSSKGDCVAPFWRLLVDLTTNNARLSGPAIIAWCETHHRSRRHRQTTSAVRCSLPEVVMTLSGSDTVYDWLIMDFSQNGILVHRHSTEGLRCFWCLFLWQRVCP